jgi:hypothetical protein
VRYGWIGGRRVRVRGVYRFSSLVKQNKKGKNCAVFYFAGKKKLLFYIYAVIVKQIFYKRSSNYYFYGVPILALGVRESGVVYSDVCCRFSCSYYWEVFQLSGNDRRLPRRCAALEEGHDCDSDAASDSTDATEASLLYASPSASPPQRRIPTHLWGQSRRGP